MSATFEDELKAISSAARTDRLKIEADAAARQKADAAETPEDVFALFDDFAFCRENGVRLSTAMRTIVVGTGRWAKSFDYDCIVIVCSADKVIQTNLFLKTGPGERILKADETKIRLMNVDTFACVAVGAQACAMDLARTCARQI